MTSFGYAQRINPHSLRISPIKDWDSHIPVWHEKYDDIYYGNNSLLISKLNGKKLSIHNPSLLNRKIKLIKILGKSGYKQIVNNVKRLSR